MTGLIVALAVLIGIIAAEFVGIVVTYGLKINKRNMAESANIVEQETDSIAVAESVTDVATIDDIAITETVEEPVAEVVEEIEQEPEIEVIPDVVEEDTEVYLGREEETGFAIIARFKKSFMARLIQSSDETKGYYSELKNAILSYKKTTSRKSWNYDSVNSGRTKVLKFAIRGKTLCVYLALNAEEFADTKYNVKAVTSKKYADVPCMIKVSGPRKKKHAFELIGLVAEKLGLVKGEEKNENYVLPFETTEELIKKELIKELISKEDYEAFVRRRQSLAIINQKHKDVVTAAEVDEIIADEIAASVVVDEHHEQKLGGKKCVINIDTLSRCYNANELVNLKSLKAKGLLPSNAGYVKVLARGTLDKPLTVEANDYSIEAVKMILLTGGKVLKY